MQGFWCRVVGYSAKSADQNSYRTLTMGTMTASGIGWAGGGLATALTSLPSFKRKLKTFLFTKSFPSV